MNRRTFTSMLGALFTTPSVSLAATAAPSATALGHFKLAKLITRAHNSCSVEFLCRHLKVDRAMATQIQSLLLQRGVITPPVAGLSMATNPMNTNCVPVEALKPTNLAQSVTQVRAQVQKLREMREKVERVLEDAETKGAEEPVSGEAISPDT